jgi:hypothetical protein
MTTRAAPPRPTEPTRRVDAGWRSWLPRVLVESVLVVFSVLLALGVDEWREKRELGRQVQDARAAFAQEIRGNRELLRGDRYHPYHRRMWAHYRELSDAAGARDSLRLDSLRKLTAARFGNGVWPTPFRSAVWRSLSQREVVGRMEPSELFLIADVYREQENVDAWHDRMFTIWSEPRSDADHPAYIRSDIYRTRSYLADVVAGEERLMRRYDEALRLLSRRP